MDLLKGHGGWVFFSFLGGRGTGLSKQKNVSSTERSLFLSYLCGPSLCTGRLEMKTEDEVDHQKNGMEEVVSAGVVTLSLAVLYKEMPLLLWFPFCSLCKAERCPVAWLCPFKNSLGFFNPCVFNRWVKAHFCFLSR